MELADQEGIDALSMRSLARRVGVEAMSLYHHVPNKDALLDAMADEVFGQIHRPVIGQPWREQLRQRSLSGRQALLRHPWAVGLMDSRRTPGMANLRHHDAVIGCLSAAGFSLPAVAHAFALLDAHLYGFVLQEVSLPFTDSGRTDAGEVAAVAAALMSPDVLAELPHFSRFTTEYAMQPGYSFGQEFEIGLDLVLDALAGLLPSSRS